MNQSKKIVGRGSIINPVNRFEPILFEQTDSAEFIEDEFQTKLNTIFYKDESRSIITKNESPDLGFDYTVNPYRGCEHGCVYCYARPYHEYLGFSSGLDFESKIMVKENAPLLLEKELRKKSWKPSLIVFSGVTDCYQPIEKKLRLTRGCLEVCLNFRNPAAIVTKNSLVLRDIDILKEMAKLEIITVVVSVTTMKNDLIQIMEPRTSRFEKRLATIEALSKEGVPVTVNVAPIIPGLNDEEIPAILKAASEAGAKNGSYIILRLPYAVKEVFLKWVEKEFPNRYKKIISKINEFREGKLNSSEFGERFRGKGVTVEAIKQLFKLNCKKYNLNTGYSVLRTDLFRVPLKKGSQLNLFE